MSYPETPPAGVDPGAYERLTEDRFALYPRTAEGLRRLVAAARPKHRDAALAYVRSVIEEGGVPSADARLLQGALPELLEDRA